MRAALYAEWVKLSRSRTPWISLLAITIGAGAGGLFMFISLHPDKARDLGLLGAKAQLATLEPTWDSYLGLVAQIAAVGGTLIFGMTMVWVFGREFADRTAKDLLSLPTSRTAIVAAKFTIGALWCLALTAFLAGVAVAIGVGLAIPGMTWAVVTVGLIRVGTTALLAFALTTVFGLAASLGRGYLPAVGTMFAAVFTAQLIAAFGYGAWYPFSVPALHAGLTGDAPTGFGYCAVVAVAAASIWATAQWWRRADHTH